MGKKSDKIRVSFIGGNADGVTGSMTLVQSPTKKILLEAGLVQTGSVLNDYRINSRRFKFKPKEIDYIFIGHVHADHCLLLPRLVKEGFSGKIFSPAGTKMLFEAMANDSAYIMDRDAEYLSKKHGRYFAPIYEPADVSRTIPLMEEYPLGEKISIDSEVCFRLVSSGHIISSAQIELWVKNGCSTKKVLYTSDLGNLSCPKFYSGDFSPVSSANLVIAETTYGGAKKSVSSKDREKDLEKLESIITEACIDNRTKVLIPIFSLDRCQNIMTHLHNLFHNRGDFDIPILVDSPLAIKVSSIYSSTLTGNDKKLWDDVRSWKNFHYLEEYNQSKTWMERKAPCVILSASGFMQAGRSRQWAKSLLPNPSSHIVFVGFSSENALASKIKNGSAQKKITIDGKQYSNRCKITDLKSFSGHMQKEELLEYYSGIDCERIALVHGDMQGKISFSKELQARVSKKNRCSKVMCVNKSDDIIL